MKFLFCPILETNTGMKVFALLGKFDPMHKLAGNISVLYRPYLQTTAYSSSIINLRNMLGYVHTRNILIGIKQILFLTLRSSKLSSISFKV